MGRRARSRVSNRQLNARTWVQVGGATPANKLQYLSKDRGQFRPGEVSRPIAGSDAVFRPSDYTYGEFQTLGTTASTPELATVQVVQDLTTAKLNLLEEIAEDGLPIAIHILFADSATNVGDRNNWKSKIVLPYLNQDSLNLSSAQGNDSDEVHIWTAEFSYSQLDRAIPVAWDAKIAATVTEPVTGTVFGASRKKQYAVQQGDGTSTEPKMFYTTDNWTSSTSVTITALAATEHPNDLVYVGSYCIAPTEANSYIYWSEDDPSTITEISSGFVSAKIPNAIYAADVAYIFMVGDGGYVYRLDNPGSAVTVLDAGTTTTNNLNDVDGIGEVVVAVGASDTIIYSTDNGVSWTAPATIPGGTGVEFLTVAVTDDLIWYVGGDDGNGYYTIDGGDTWGSLSFTGSGTGNVTKIEFFKKNPAYGLLARDDGSTATVYRTTDGGFSWEQVSLTNFPTAAQVDALAIFDPNTFLAGAQTTAGADGVLALAKGSRHDD